MTAPHVRRLFELYATGQYSLAALRNEVFANTGRKFAKSGIERILKNHFYIGLFSWGGKTYQGTHTPLVSRILFEEVQQTFRNHNRPKYKQHDFPFAGLLQCAHDNCTVTAEVKKVKYVYYHCTGHRGTCPLPYMREEQLGLRLGEVLQGIHIPDGVLACLQTAFREDQARSKEWQKQERERLQKRLSSVRSRIDQAYLDKLDGKITEEFWQRKTEEWQREERQVLMALAGIEQAEPDRLLTINRILELANKAHFLYVRQNPAEQAKLLKMVVSNCGIDELSIYPTYRKPFDLIFKAAKNENWLGR
jgi:site-specific DNA recombinase